MKFNYENRQYLKMLEQDDHSVGFYQKYLNYVKKYLRNRRSSFIDIGCGNGNVLVPLMDCGYKNIYGCEISKLFINSARTRGLKNVFWYDGGRIPFSDNYFDVVGSFGVLEHVEDPILFLKEHVRIVKKGGHVVVACPNFLTVFFKLEHPRVDKLVKRLRNIPKILEKLLNHGIFFESVNPIIRKKFHGDDDMVTISNLIDIERFFEKNDCSVICSNGFMVVNNQFLRVVGSVPLLKYFLPSCFLVARKR